MNRSLFLEFRKGTVIEVTIPNILLKESDNVTAFRVRSQNVTVKDQPGLGAITDMNGRYTIQVEEFSRLEFSYVGFEKKEVLIKRQKEVNVVLKEATTSEIDEVIVTGTGAQKKLTVTGAVTNVDVDVLKSKALVNYTVANLIL